MQRTSLWTARAGALAAALLLPGAAVAQAQNYPDRPIRFIVPFTPGSSVDITARIVGDVVSRDLGQPVIIENRAGAGGNIAAEYTAKQPADGYTIMVGTTGNVAASKALYKNLRYDPETDFTSVSHGWWSWNLLVVRTESPFTSARQLIAEAKANPGKFNFGSPGVGTAGHLAGELFRRLTNTDMVHVPFKGQTEEINALISGQLHFTFESIGNAAPQMKAGRLRALAVTSKERLQQIPDVPTYIEAGIPGDFELRAWGMYLAPAKTPPAVVRKLSDSLVKAMGIPQVRERIDSIGVQTFSSTPEAGNVIFKDEIRRWAQVVKTVNVQLD